MDKYIEESTEVSDALRVELSKNNKSNKHLRLQNPEF